MRTDVVLTLTGPDRVGIVEEVTGVLLELGGNVGTSSMARLGGEFAILMMVSIPAEKTADLDSAFERLVKQGYKVTTGETASPAAESRSGWLSYRVDVRGADHEGIVHGIARGLSLWGINIESMETGTTRAPMSGTRLFSMTARVAVPPDVVDSDWKSELNDAGRASGVDVAVTAVETE